MTAQQQLTDLRRAHLAGIERLVADRAPAAAFNALDEQVAQKSRVLIEQCRDERIRAMVGSSYPAMLDRAQKDPLAALGVFGVHIALMFASADIVLMDGTPEVNLSMAEMVEARAEVRQGGSMSAACTRLRARRWERKVRWINSMLPRMN